jgi:DNA-binding transcriptional ArsR family regulator
MLPSGISRHRVQVFLALKTGKNWWTNEELADATGISPRTARAHTKALTDMGIVEAAAVFPGYRYRLSPNAERDNKNYVARMTEAAEILGLNAQTRDKSKP